MNSKAKSAVRVVAERFAGGINGEKPFSEGVVLNFNQFFTEHEWEFSPPYSGRPETNKILIQFS